ncbi:hypothetical protein PR202_gb15384 [Eleusine coracana subsp. coracana]|uniref:Uncharacterized protein n=1 Tax=Eleusine coracana subsp. coracana TaxID=191504 RepID=A0AAV5EXH3_ELECO|nr:hypothetical protein PR202_gb15384 [Eleusine coracana subsp. coracana]
MCRCHGVGLYLLQAPRVRVTLQLEPQPQLHCPRPTVTRHQFVDQVEWTKHEEAYLTQDRGQILRVAKLKLHSRSQTSRTSL